MGEKEKSFWREIEQKDKDSRLFLAEKKIGKIKDLVFKIGEKEPVPIHRGKVLLARIERKKENLVAEFSRK